MVDMSLRCAADGRLEAGMWKAAQGGSLLMPLKQCRVGTVLCYEGGWCAAPVAEKCREGKKTWEGDGGQSRSETGDDDEGAGVDEVRAALGVGRAGMSR